MVIHVREWIGYALGLSYSIISLELNLELRPLVALCVVGGGSNELNKMAEQWS
jgi:hypothetical protein